MTENELQDAIDVFEKEEKKARAVGNVRLLINVLANSKQTLREDTALHNKLLAEIAARQADIQAQIQLVQQLKTEADVSKLHAEAERRALTSLECDTTVAEARLAELKTEQNNVRQYLSDMQKKFA